MRSNAFFDGGREHQVGFVFWFGVGGVGEFGFGGVFGHDEESNFVV